MPSQAATAELEAPPSAQRDLAEGGQEQEPQDAQPAAAAAAAFEETLAGPAEPIPPSDTPQDTNSAAIPSEPSTKPQGITEKTWLGLGLKGRVYVTSLIEDGNALKAYKTAGYTADSEKGDSEKRKRNAYNVSRGKRVQRALLEHADHRKALAEAKKDFALDWIVSEHERLKELAEKAGDLAVATRNLELIGRTRGAYADVALIDPTWRREYSETERLEGKRIARLALKDGMGGPAALPPGESASVEDGGMPGALEGEDADEGGAEA